MTTTAPDRVSLRPAEQADLLAIHRIERAAFSQPWPYQAFEGFLGEPGFLVAVGVPDGGAENEAGADGDESGTVVESAAGLDLESSGAGAGDGHGSGVVCGYVIADVVSEFGRTIGHVKDIAVHPDWRGRGVGSRLLSRALSVLEAGGARRVKLEVRAGNRRAQALYRSFGFSANRVVSGYYDDGEDAVLFVADLTERAGDR